MRASSRGEDRRSERLARVRVGERSPRAAREWMNDVDVRRIEPLRYSCSSRNIVRASRRSDGATNASAKGRCLVFRLASVSPSSRLRLTFVDPTRPAWVPPAGSSSSDSTSPYSHMCLSLGAPSPAPPRAFARRLFRGTAPRVSRDPPPPCVRSPSGARYLLPPNLRRMSPASSTSRA